MDDTSHLPADDVLRRIGNELEAVYRSAGVGLPVGLTPDQFARAILQGMHHELEQWSPHFQSIYSEVQAELGPGASSEEFLARLDARIEEWTRQHRNRSGPAASA
jgi:hypothetical protein